MHHERDTDQRLESMKPLEELAYLAVHRAAPLMEKMNAGELKCQVEFQHKENGLRYRSTILVQELDEDDSTNIDD